MFTEKKSGKASSRFHKEQTEDKIQVNLSVSYNIITEIHNLNMYVRMYLESPQKTKSTEEIKD